MDGGFVDLHIHSDFSDGHLSPEEIVEDAVWKGLSAIALTDHDNIDGLLRFRAAGEKQGIEVINGVELSCEHDGKECHILGLLIEPDHSLCERLCEMRDSREERMQEMLDKLSNYNIHISMEDLPVDKSRSLGRPHLAHVLVKRGYVNSVSEAFSRYLGDDCPAYVSKKRFSVSEAVSCIKSCGGVSILAHPGLNSWTLRLDEFWKLGIDGGEAFCPKNTLEDETIVQLFCRSHGLLVSGGSDFHVRESGPDLGICNVSYEVLEAIKARRK